MRTKQEIINFLESKVGGGVVIIKYQIASLVRLLASTVDRLFIFLFFLLCC